MPQGDYSGKRVLVTGGAGFIGSNLAIRLVEAGARVTVVDSLVPACGGNPFNLEPVRGKIQYVQADLRDRPAALYDAEYIFNCAGQCSHQDSITNPREDLELNVLAHLQLLEACREKNPGAVIVYTSTRQIFGAPKYLPVDEEHPIEPFDINGINKYSGEQHHRLYAKVHGLKTVSLRLTNTFGPRQLIEHARQGFIGWFVNRAITGNPIQLFGGGGQLRDFNYVNDACEALLLAGSTPECHGKIYNLSGEKSDLVNVASLLVDYAGGGKVEKIPFPPDRKKIDIGDFYGTSEKFRTATGWTPRVSLADGLKEMVRYFREHSEKYL